MDGPLRFDLGCPGRGAASGTPRGGPRHIGVGAGRGQHFSPRGVNRAWPRRSLEGQGGAVLGVSRLIGYAITYKRVNLG